MTRTIEPEQSKMSTALREDPNSGPFHDTARQVRALLHADYAAVATIHAGSFVVRAVAGPGDAHDSLPPKLAARMANLGALVINEARLITMPVLRGDRIAALLAAYSGPQRRFSAEDRDRLREFSERSAGRLDMATTVESDLRNSLLSEDELLHISRQLTIAELSVCFSHEVNNPLTTLLGNIQLIGQVISEDDPIRLQLTSLLRNTRRIESMSKSMLDFSRKREKKREVCTVEELIVEAIRFVQPRFAKPERPVDVNIQPDCPEIHVEKWRIVHALVNLLNNASDAVDGCLTRIVTLSARSEGGFIFLSVSDTGNGIPPEIVDRVFHPFFTTKGERGNGLGLYITRLTVEEHCGTITLQTNENGTTFTMCLPVQEGTTSMQ